MSKKKWLFLIIIVVVAIGLGYYYMLEPSTFVERVKGVWASILASPQKISEFISNPTAAIGTLSGVGGATAAAVTLYSKLNQTRKQAGEAISTVSGELQQARTQTAQLKADLDTVKTQSTTVINQLKGEKLDAETKLIEVQGQLQAKNSELDKLRAEFNLMERLKFPTVVEKVVVK